MKKIVCIILIIMLCITGCTSNTQPIEVLEEGYDENVDDIEEVVTSKAETYDLQWAKEMFEENYFEPDLIYPISYIEDEYQYNLGEFIFVLHGFYGVKLAEEGNSYGSTQIMINSIEISRTDNEFYQLIDGLYTDIPFNHGDEIYGFEVGDWNGDGVCDFKLRVSEGGTMHNEPSRFWLWDNEQSMFVENEQLGEISDYSTVYLASNKDNRLCSYTRYSISEYCIRYYEYKDREYICVEEEHDYFETQDGVEYRITEFLELIDGEMQVVDTKKSVYEEN